uniref:ATP-binding protein n=1 Tax=unclassified Paraburkholderia TaxID=2615204 RepID=UPI0038BA22A9
KAKVVQPELYRDIVIATEPDEVARRDQKKLGARLARAGFALGKTLETFNFDLLPKLNRAHIHDLATGRYIDEKVCVLMVGQIGVGKSHLAQALGHCAARQGRDVLFISQTDLLKKLHAARATGIYERKFQQFVRVPLLIVGRHRRHRRRCHHHRRRQCQCQCAARFHQALQADQRFRMQLMRVVDEQRDRLLPFADQRAQRAFAALSNGDLHIYTGTSLSEAFILMVARAKRLMLTRFSAPGLPVQRYFGSVKRVCRKPVCCSRFANSSRAASIAGWCSTAQLWSDRSGTINDLPRSVSS